MASQQDRAQVEEVINEAGKVYLPPCQIACPLGEDIQRSHAMLALLRLEPEEAANQIIKIGRILCFQYAAIFVGFVRRSVIIRMKLEP